MTDLPDDVRASLREAGIMPRYHHMSLNDMGPMGKGMVRWLETEGAAIRGGRSILFQGLGLTDHITMLCRGLHLNGVGCKVVSLVKLRGLIRDAEALDDLADTQVLAIMNAYDATKGCPLHDATVAEVEHLIRSRIDDSKAVFFHAPTDEANSIGANGWWSEELVHTLGERFDLLTPLHLERLGA